MFLVRVQIQKHMFLGYFSELIYKRIYISTAHYVHFTLLCTQKNGKLFILMKITSNEQ